MVPTVRRLRNRNRAGTTCMAAITAALLTTACEPIAGASGGHGSAGGGSSGGIPDNYRALYKKAGSTCTGIDWATLAAVGKIESGHGQSKKRGVRSGSNSAGAQGPMQFLPDTWRGVRQRHPDIGSNVYDPANAIPAAAHKLCDDGASKSVRNALFSYNHSQAYVNQVLAQAKEYR
jgi:soluble lytic murein transglycosylase-like protein